MNGENVQQQNQARRRSTFWATWVTPKFQSNQIANRIFVFIFCINMIWKKIISIKYHNITWNRKTIQRMGQIDENHRMIQPIIFQLNRNSAFLAWFKSMITKVYGLRHCIILSNDVHRISKVKFVLAARLTEIIESPFFKCMCQVLQSLLSDT